MVHRHPDAVVILWQKGDIDHVFFLTMAQLFPCLRDMQPTTWSIIVFWNESFSGSRIKTGPDVGLDFTDQPAPVPPGPPQPADDDDLDCPGYADPHGEMPVDDE